ncbi:transaldolase [Terriglobus roseus]|uniref:Transaldolase n=1 Tax=Terriglobus roseus TaxID=392734 RepID=A0A1G7HA94_9BACT|nr:transaldolase [Terriglobus roseus]SDE97214.1 transaldolase [Terriglobus roseus]
MPTMLEQLRTMTTVVADTGDMNSIRAYAPTDATTNPSLLEAAAKMPEYQSIVDDVLRSARRKAGTSASSEEVSAAAFKTLAVAFGRKILEIVPGRVSTEMDARLSFDREKTIEEARDVIRQYDEAGISRERVLIKIAATWEGIQAAGILEKEGIHCNLTLLFGIHQAVACAEAGVTLISPFVGRILDWHKANTGKTYTGAEDPGVKSVTEIYRYYKKFGYSTQIMGASFRNLDEVKELAGCDLLTISPTLLSKLALSREELPRKLNPQSAKEFDVEKLPMDQQIFERMHAADSMAHEQLSDGIERFSKALESLEALLLRRTRELESD